MYYESIPLDMAYRAFGAETQVRGYYRFNDCTNRDPRANPDWNPLQTCPNVYGNNTNQGPPPTGNTVDLSRVPGASSFTLTSSNYSPVSPDLKGAYTQQFGGGIQYEVLQDLTLGLDYLGRRYGPAIEDMSVDGGTNYFIANPGVSQPWSVTTGPYAGMTFNALNAPANVTNGNVISLAWPKAVRDYDSFSVSINKLFSKKWLAQASYTWSSLRGNYGGLFRRENAQLDPNLTSEYDLANLMGNKTGPLNGNKSNQIKLAGSYNATLTPDVTFVPSVNFQAFSGAPVSALAAHPDYGPGESYLLPRGMAGDLAWTYQLDVGAKMLWAISGPYTLQFSLDIFNILNMTTAQWVDMNYTLDTAVPMQNAQCTNKNSATAKDPIGALQAACQDLPYARTTSGSRVNVNLSYGRPVNGTYAAYQTPISARFGVALSF